MKKSLFILLFVFCSSSIYCQHIYSQHIVNDTLIVEGITKDSSSLYLVSFYNRAMILQLSSADFNKFKLKETEYSENNILVANIKYDITTNNIISFIKIPTTKLQYYNIMGINIPNISESLLSNMEMKNSNRLDTILKFQKNLANAIPTNKLITIFNFIKNKSCTATSDFNTGYCIPFEYAYDGCYARAQAMKDIIEDTFNFQTQKIFTNSKNRRKSIRVSKYDKCITQCISWIFHVTVLVNEQLQNGDIIQKVIDPSLFPESPVTIEQWVNKQKECNGRVIGPFIKPSYYYFENTVYDAQKNDAYNTLDKYFELLKELCYR